MEMDCHLLADGRCFYDGSGLEAGQPWKILREQGSDAVWQFLDTYYANLFEVAS